MDQNELDQQSQHWEKNFSNKPEMFGLEPSISAKKALNFFKEKKINNIIELGAGLVVSYTHLTLPTTPYV